MLVVVAFAAVLAACVGQDVQYLDLNGAWSVTNGSSGYIPATVPGQIHTDLMAANIIGP